MIKKNSFYLYLIYFGALLFLHLLFFPIFMAFPEPFYHRPWEYFNDLAYRNNKYATKWQGKEYGDLTRDNYFCRQESYETSVTTDKDGFRSVPFDNSDAKILFSGDSQIFGSSLSDQETLPWIFSELTGIPVFNGSRTSLANVIKKPELGQVRIIIDGKTERNIMPQSFNDIETEFTPLKHNNSSLFEILSTTSPDRFSPYYLLPRSLFRVFSDLNLILKGICNPEYSFLSHRMLEDQLLSTISAIKKRSIIYNNLGYRYIFLPIPAKQTLYDKSIDPFTRDFLNLLSKELAKNNIEHINLLPAFSDEKGGGLYNKYDTHWNKNGTHLAAQIIANHLNNNPTEEIK